LEQVLLNVQAQYYGPTAQSNTGPGLLAKAIQDALDQVPGIAHRMIFGKYQWNKYTFGGKLDVVTHKCSGCEQKATKDEHGRTEWVTGNDYVNLHLSNHYYCQDARSILKS
jgi:hypothetical protein